MRSFQIRVISLIPLLLCSANSFLLTTRVSKPSFSSLLYSSSDESTFKKDARWSSLSPTVKQRIIEEAQARAIRNKKKREPAAEKKRRLMMQYKTAQMQAKKVISGS